MSSYLIRTLKHWLHLPRWTRHIKTKVVPAKPTLRNQKHSGLGPGWKAYNDGNGGTFYHNVSQGKICTLDHGTYHTLSMRDLIRRNAHAHVPQSQASFYIVKNELDRRKYCGEITPDAWHHLDAHGREIQFGVWGPGM